MRITGSVTGAQRVAIRFGAVMLLLAAVVMGVLAITVDGGEPSYGELSPVESTDTLPLPGPALFGGTVVVYGSSARPGVEPGSLGCQLVSRGGNLQSQAKMSATRAAVLDPVEVDGALLQPLFTVSGYPAGSSVDCESADALEPVYVSESSTFGNNGSLVKASASASSLTCLVLGLAGLYLTRRRSGPSELLGPS